MDSNALPRELVLLIAGVSTSIAIWQACLSWRTRQYSERSLAMQEEETRRKQLDMQYGVRLAELTQLTTHMATQIAVLQEQLNTISKRLDALCDTMKAEKDYRFRQRLGDQV